MLSLLEYSPGQLEVERLIEVRMNELNMDQVFIKTATAYITV